MGDLAGRRFARLVTLFVLATVAGWREEAELAEVIERNHELIVGVEDLHAL
jgi:hypothetical protein